MTKGQLKSNLLAEMTSRTHLVHSGLPPELGGQDEAATPHELLEAALAACTILTVQLYAKRKGLKLTGLNADIQIIKEDREGTILKRTLHFDGDLTSDERQRLLEIAEKCPIHRLLSGPVSIQTDVQ